MSVSHNNFSIDKESWNKIKNKSIYKNFDLVCDHIKSSIVNQSLEKLHILLLIKDNIIRNSQIVAVGTVDHIHVSIRFVVESILKENKVDSVIISHNHTSGDPTPSWQDISYTKALHYALAPLDITLFDHLIMSKNNYFSLRRHCLLF